MRRDRGADILRRYFALGGDGELISRAWHSTEDPALERIQDVTVARKLLGDRGPPSFKVLNLSKPLHVGCAAVNPTACQDCLEVYSDRFQSNWATVMAMIDYVSSHPAGVPVKTEYAAGSDIYHALGAARTAIATAALAVIGYQVVRHLVAGHAVTAQAVGAFVVGAGVVFVLGYAQYQVIHSARERCATHLAIRTAAGLAWFSRRPNDG